MTAVPIDLLRFQNPLLFRLWRRLLIFILCGSVLACSREPQEIDLFESAKDGRLDRVALAINEGIAVDERDLCRFTPLMHAALAGHAEVVDALIAHGAAVEVKDKAGYTPLMLAAGNAHIEVAKRLLRAGANVNHVEHTNGWTPLIVAARDGNEAMVKLLLKHGARPNLADKEGVTPLLWAMRLGHTSLAPPLLPNP